MKPKRYWKKGYQYAFQAKDWNLVGIYFLLKGKEIVYIGKTLNIVMRMYGHSNKKFDTFRLIGCEKEVRDRYEQRWIRKFKPKYNINHNKDIETKSPMSIFVRIDRAKKLRELAKKEQKTISIMVENALENQYGI